MKILSQPYPIDLSGATRFRVAGLFSLFVFSFLFIFQPFGLQTYPGSIFLVTLGYGLTCFAAMLIANLLIPLLFPSFFKEDNWTTLKQLAFTALNILAVAVANGFYSAVIGIALINFHSFAIFLLYTLAIGIFPISILILINQNQLRQKFETNSTRLNSALAKRHLSHKLSLESEHASIPITISSENKNEEIHLDLDDLLFMQSADNYIEVHFMKNNLPAKSIVRNSLKQVEQDLKEYKSVFRCHKSFLVNTNKVSSFSGNAQGYKLHFDNTEYKVPVSRRLNKKVHDLFSSSN